jgi:O-antigen biosynthesis protein
VQLSVIIVNYNVKYFLEHCLISVQAACQNIEAQIIVVDNNSTDGSVQLLHQKYPNVICIANTQNVGFAKANNQGVALARGQYVLFLNPDTIVPEDCFEKCLAQMQTDATIGGLGVHLIDGKGQYLPESKRGFPDAATAFFKIFGINNLFKKSAFINNYYMGHLAENNSNYVDVLVGCFLLMPKSLINKIGAFDEDYFMYGEDIDLSYKITKAGFKNYYLASTTVIHYKGESTKKGSLNYVKMFYNAMIIFAQKHLSTAKQSTYIPLLKTAIFLKAIIAYCTTFLKRIFFPIVDASIMLAALFFTKNYWATNVKQQANYKPEILFLFFTAYIFIWVISIFLNGGYDAPIKKEKIIKGMAIGAVVALAIYGLLPEANRFSRGITLFGAVASTIIMWLLRFVLQFFKIINGQLDTKQIITITDTTHEQEVIQLLKTAGIDKDIVSNIYTTNNSSAVFSQLKNIAQLYANSEIIFTYPALSFAQIIEQTIACGPQHNYKIHAQGTESIIGSNSKNTAGDLYASDYHFAIATAAGRRNKRLFDVISSSALILLYPIFFIFLKNKSSFKNALNVVLAKATWVGYNTCEATQQLPKIKAGVYTLTNQNMLAPELAQQVNITYARNYTTQQDFKIVWQNLF